VKKVLDGLEKTITVICSVLFIGIALLIAAQVFTRYVMNNALSWSEQAARMLFIWMTLLYASVLVRKMANLGFDIVVKMLPKTARDIVQILGELIVLGFALYWAYQSIALCSSFTSLKFSGIKIPYNIIYSAEPVGATLIAIFSVEIILNHIKAMLAERGAAK